MHHTYILFSEALNKYYVGSTSSDVEVRLKKHLQTHNGFTAKAKDWKVVYTKSFMNVGQARAWERKIKSWKSTKAILKLMEEKQ